ncbi:MAG: extracellular solute-binding protein [Lachnospiraceae bacterium]|nr:extracellular solute-binding protein [Lachnospiraceae bacterium]
MKKLWGLLGVCMVSALLGGCSAQEEENGVCSVYYVNTHSYYATAVAGFQNKNEEAQIELIGFESDEALVSQLATEMAAGEGPDVVLLSGDTQFDVYKAARSGQVLDLNKYIEKDEAYNEENYLISVMEAGKIRDEKQMVLPFSFTMDVLYMPKSSYEELGAADEDLVNYETMSQMLVDYSKGLENEKFSQSYANTLNAESYLERSLSNADVINSATLEVSRDAVDAVMEITNAIEEEVERKTELQSKEAKNPFELIMSITRNGNYFTGYAVANGMTQFYSEEECITIPWRNMDGKIQPYVCDFGLVTSQSDSKQTSYDLLRYIMDYEVATEFNRPMSVSIRQLNRLLNYLELKKISIIGENYKSIKLNEEQKAALWQDVQDMATANFSSCGYMDVITEKLNQNPDISMEDLEDALQRYLYE